MQKWPFSGAPERFFGNLPLSNFKIQTVATLFEIQSDPDLPGSSGERVLPGKSGCPVYRDQIPLIPYIGGNLFSR